jgi:hypothetical protein
MHDFPCFSRSQDDCVNWLRRQCYWLVFGRHPFRISTGTPTTPIEVFSGFSYLLQAKSTVVLYNRLRSLPSKYCPIHHSVITPTFVATHSQLLTEILNELLLLILWLYSPLLDLGGFFRFFILYTVSRTSWTGDQAVARPLPTHRTTQTE